MADIRNTAALVNRVGETDHVEILRRLGLWTTDAHRIVKERPPMRADFSSMPGSLIADEMAKWTAEASRLLELHGVLQAAKIRQDITVKHAQNVARSRVREEARKEIEDADSSRTKMPTATEINDLIEADQTLREARTDMGEVEALLAGVKAVLEATNLILNALSREITRRGDQSRGAV